MLIEILTWHIYRNIAPQETISRYSLSNGKVLCLREKETNFKTTLCIEFQIINSSLILFALPNHLSAFVAKVYAFYHCRIRPKHFGNRNHSPKFYSTIARIVIWHHILWRCSDIIKICENLHRAELFYPIINKIE